MDKIVSIGISGLCDRGVDFIDFVEKWRRGYVVIGNMRIGWCRGREPLVEFLVMRVGGCSRILPWIVKGLFVSTFVWVLGCPRSVLSGRWCRRSCSVFVITGSSASR